MICGDYSNIHFSSPRDDVHRVIENVKDAIIINMIVQGNDGDFIATTDGLYWYIEGDEDRQQYQDFWFEPVEKGRRS